MTVSSLRVGITLTSSLEVDESYIQLTKLVARYLAGKKAGVVYGGTAYGMMRTLGETYKQAGGEDLVGVMAKDLAVVTKSYIAYDGLDESYFEETMEERKYRIINLSDAYLILPGGYGTLEEIGSILGGKVNKLYDKPIAIYNHNHFYDTFIAFLSEMHSARFSKIAIQEVAFVSDDMGAIFDYFLTYTQKELADKFV